MTSNASGEKDRETASFRGQLDSKTLSQSDASYSPLSKSENSRSGNKYDKYEYSDDEDQQESKLQNRIANLKSYAQEQLATASGAAKVQGEFQKAHIRKLQQEREGELYGRFLKNSAQKVREKWLEEKQRSTPKASETLGKSDNTDKSKSEYNERSQLAAKSPSDFGGRLAAPVADTYQKFNRIENKITDLERDLDQYQKDMNNRYQREISGHENFDKAYDRVDSKVKLLKKELDKSLERQKDIDYGEEK